MVISIDQPEAAKVVVFLNGRPLKVWLQARDGSDGWVDVPDLSAMAEIDLTPTDPKQCFEEAEAGTPVSEYESFPTKRLHGSVEFRRANIMEEDE